LEKVEEVSYLLKNADAHHIDEFLKIEDKRNYDAIAQSMSDHVATVEALFAGPKAPEDDPEAVPEVGPVGMVQNLAADSKIFQWAGIGFGESETYLLQKSLKKLAGEQNLTNVRLFGKILGTESDYFVVETDNNAEEDAGAEEGEDVVDMEAKGTGANTFAYYVSTNACSSWTKLPDVQPKEISDSR
jgi:radial spoke head protein 4A